MFVITSLLPLPVSAAYAAGQTLYSTCIIRKVAVDSLFKAAFVPSVVLFCSECKQFGGVITINSVNTVGQDIKTSVLRVQSKEVALLVVLNLPNPVYDFLRVRRR